MGRQYTPPLLGKGGVEVFKRILFIQVMNVNNREIQTNIYFSPLTFFSSVSALYHYIFFYSLKFTDVGGGLQPL